MTELTQEVDEQKQSNPSNLLDLYKHYWSVLHAELDFCHQYLNFYSGLLSALLAATLAGLLGLKFRGWDELTLLLGPILIGVLAYNGYNTVKTFYKRFVDAWVATLNLESMLGIRYAYQPSDKPRYVSHYGSFIPTMEDDRMMEILEGKEKKKKIRFISRLLHPGQKNEGAAQAETAEQVAKASSESSNGVTREKSAEQVAKELSKSRKGTTLSNAKITFITFGVAAVVLAVFILLTMASPSLFQQWLPGQ
jgi:hypothetical protein